MTTAADRQHAVQLRVEELMREGALFGSAVVQARFELEGVEVELGRVYRPEAVLARHHGQPGHSGTTRRYLEQTRMR